MSLLEVQDLRVHFETDDGVVKAVDGASFAVDRGKTLGIVGESGCGKSVANLTILGLTRAPNTTISGRILLDGRDLTEMSADELQTVRGKEIAMIFQDPLTSLHPFYKVGKQLVEAINAHQDISRDRARKRAVEMLGLVGIPDPSRRVDDYPHEFSGGMRQRAMIAMALVNEPHVLIADEPTGRIVEEGTLDQIFYDPQHPYTWGLLGSIARPDRPRVRRLAQIKGQPPSLLAPPQGCHFRPRCPYEFDKCGQVPGLEVRGGEPGHRDRCWLAPDRKRTLRVVGDGQIGLEVPA